MDRVLITGGTGTIGGKLIEALSHNGVKIFFQYGQNEKYAQYLSKQYDAVAIQWCAECTDEMLISQLFPQDIDMLINCIGAHVSVGNTETVNTAEMEMLHKVNVIAPFQFIRHVLPFMRIQRKGYILNVSSICGIMIDENNLPYILSKHALTAMTKCIAAEYGKYGIVCNEICPNMIDSKMMQRIFQKEAEKYNIPLDIYIKKASEGMYNRHLLTPESVVQTILCLISDKIKDINGQSIILG